MEHDREIFVLLLQCEDKVGIVARVSDFILRNDGNIITADQYSTDPEGGHFFMRVEFVMSKFGPGKLGLKKNFTPVAKEFAARWNIYSKRDKLRMGIMVSRFDHCLFDLLYLWRSGGIKAEIPFVISNYSGHQELVEQFKVPFCYIPADKSDRKEKDILSKISATSDFLVLARYMLIFSRDFLSRYGKDIINIHHGFLPSFKGARPYHQALREGVKVIGATAHFVSEELDAGPIIAQALEHISHRDDLKSLVQKGENLEKRSLAQAIMQYLDYRVIKYQNKTIVF